MVGLFNNLGGAHTLAAVRVFDENFENGETVLLDQDLPNWPSTLDARWKFLLIDPRGQGKPDMFGAFLNTNDATFAYWEWPRLFGAPLYVPVSGIQTGMTADPNRWRFAVANIDGNGLSVIGVFLNSGNTDNLLRVWTGPPDFRHRPELDRRIDFGGITPDTRWQLSLLQGPNTIDFV